MSMDDSTKRRYARHLLVQGIGESGQQALLDARVLVIGAGGLGAAAISYLAAAGIGTLGIVDYDVVELSNLNRQILHETGDIGRNKVESAMDRIEELNPGCTVIPHRVRFDESNARALVKDYDIIVDALDSFAARFSVNDACIAEHKPWVHAAIRGWEGELSVFIPDDKSPCYRCLIPDLPPATNECAVHGILGPIAGVMGSLQAVEVIKLIADTGTPISGKLLRYDGRTTRFKESFFEKNPECMACNPNISP